MNKVLLTISGGLLGLLVGISLGNKTEQPIQPEVVEASGEEKASDIKLPVLPKAVEAKKIVATELNPQPESEFADSQAQENSREKFAEQEWERVAKEVTELERTQAEKSQETLIEEANEMVSLMMPVDF